MLNEHNEHLPMLDYSALDIPQETIPLTAAEKAFAQRFLIVDRRLQFLQELIAQQTFDLQFERSERQGEVDSLSSHFLKELAEIRAAQTVDGLQIANTQADIAQLKGRIDRLKPSPSKTSPTLKTITQKQIVRFLMIITAGLMGFAAIDRGEFRLTISPTGIFLLGGAGALLTLNHKLED